MKEFCEHPLCDYDGRQEYCEIEGRDPEGPALVVTDLIDYLVYENNRLASDEYRLSTDGKLQTLDRTVSYLSAVNPREGVWPLRTEISICHQINKGLGSEHYGVEVSWRLAHGQTNDGAFRTRYYIDIYPEGRVQSLIEHPKYEGGYEERPLTPYDYQQLFDTISMAFQLPAGQAS